MRSHLDYAAAFFLLADSLKDAVGICLRQLDDFHLAIIIARVYEGDNGPVLRGILKDHLLPLAFARGHRRLAVWALWMLNRRDLAVRMLVVGGARCIYALWLTPLTDSPAYNARSAWQSAHQTDRSSRAGRFQSRPAILRTSRLVAADAAWIIGDLTEA